MISPDFNFKLTSTALKNNQEFMKQEQDDVEDDCSNDEEDNPDTIKIHVDVVIKGILPDLPDITT